MKQRTILSIFGTRPEAIKMAPVIRLLAVRQELGFKSVVCVTGQHREMLDQVLRLFDITPDVDLDLMSENQTLADITSNAVHDLTPVLQELKPDLVLVQGDTTTAMAAALASFYLRIPVGHVEAGLRTSDRYNPFPEEINRRLISTIASYHFAPTQRAAQALRAEGVAEHVYTTGNTVIDALLWVSSLPMSGEVRSLLSKLDLCHNEASGNLAGLNGARLILVTAHRRENFGQPFEEICHGIRELARRNDDVVIVYPVHFNPNVREPVRRILDGEPRVRLIDPLDYQSFTHLLRGSYLVLTDSGGIQEEAPALGKPVLVLRLTTERPEAVESGGVKMIGADAERIVFEAEQLLRDERIYTSMARAVSPYGDGHAAERILDILASVRLRPASSEPAGGRARNGR